MTGSSEVPSALQGMSILRTFLPSHAARIAMMAVLYAGSLLAVLGMGLILAVDLDKLAVAQLWALLALVLFVLTLRAVSNGWSVRVMRTGVSYGVFAAKFL